MAKLILKVTEQNGQGSDKKAFVGHDHGQDVEGTDGKEPTTEKQWRDMPKGSRPAKPSEQHDESKPETQKATGNDFSRQWCSTSWCIPQQA